MKDIPSVETADRDIDAALEVKAAIEKSDDPFSTATYILGITLNAVLRKRGDAMSQAEFEILQNVGRRLNTADDYLHVDADLLD